METYYEDAPEFEQTIESPEEQPVTAVDVASSLAIAKGEIDQQIATAKRYPRSVKKFIDTATELATLDEQTADECIYALPRDGKTIEGPSARFAEIIAYAWGNCRAGARTVGEDQEFVKAQGTFYDLERNVGIQFEVSRRITDRKGNRFKADMIGTTANAAGSIALRNAVLKGIPKAFWKKAYERSRAVVAGDFKTLANRRAEALKQFAIYGVSPEQLYGLLQVKGLDDITLDHMVVLKGVLTAFKEGETTPEQVFAQGPTENRHFANKSGLDDIKSKYANPPQASPEPQAQPLTPEEQAQVNQRRGELKEQTEAVSRKRGHRNPQSQGAGTAPAAQEIFGEQSTSNDAEQDGN